MLYSNLESFYLRYPGFGLFILDNVSRESNNTVVPVCSVMWCLQTTLTIHEAFYSVCIIPHLSTSCSKSLCGKHGSSKSKDPHDAKLPIQEERCMISLLKNENSLLQPLESRPMKTASENWITNWITKIIHGRDVFTVTTLFFFLVQVWLAYSDWFLGLLTLRWPS